jgi:hypothetical protein
MLNRACGTTIFEDAGRLAQGDCKASIKDSSMN